MAVLTSVAFNSPGQSSPTTRAEKNIVATCEHCGKTSCDPDCASNSGSQSKALLPSCNLSNSQLTDRKIFLQSTLAKKIKQVKELKTGYDLVFTEPKEYAKELLDFINFERNCCSSFSFALVFEPNEGAIHLQIFGSRTIKAELSTGFKELGLIK